MVTLITAEAARAITDDVFNNRVGEEIPKAIETILQAANRGRSSDYICTPTWWGKEQKEAFANIFVSLGYSVIIHPSAIEFHW